MNRKILVIVILLLISLVINIYFFSNKYIEDKAISKNQYYSCNFEAMYGYDNYVSDEDFYKNSICLTEENNYSYEGELNNNLYLFIDEPGTYKISIIRDDNYSNDKKYLGPNGDGESIMISEIQSDVFDEGVSSSEIIMNLLENKDEYHYQDNTDSEKKHLQVTRLTENDETGNLEKDLDLNYTYEDSFYYLEYKSPYLKGTKELTEENLDSYTNMTIKIEKI